MPSPLRREACTARQSWPHHTCPDAFYHCTVCGGNTSWKRHPLGQAYEPLDYLGHPVRSRVECADQPFLREGDMPTIYGREYTPDEIRRRVGHVDQLAGIKLVEGADGLERGNRVLEAWTGTGLSYQVQADRALDICACRYKGVALAWLSPVREAHPAHYEPAGLGWLRTFPGGLLATCGLDQFGAPSRDGDDDLGLHGRISNLPARSVAYRTYWNGDAYELEITGEVRQARLFGENLVLRRRVTSQLGSSTIRLRDTVTNEGFSPHPHMILYHFNIGFPMLCEESVLSIEADLTEPRDEVAAEGLDKWDRFQTPTPGYSEQVFHHMPAADRNGLVGVELVSPALGMGLRWTYSREALPHLFQWKMMGEGAYVLGIEPANSSGIHGRAAARESGDLPYLAPGQSVTYDIALEVFELAVP